MPEGSSATLTAELAAAERLTLCVGDQLQQASRRPLGDFLGVVASDLVAAGRLRGALLVALDGETILSFGSHAVDAADRDAALSGFEPSPPSGWGDAGPHRWPLADGGQGWMYPLARGGRPAGGLVALADGDPGEALGPLLPFLATGVATAVEVERWDRIERLQALLHRGLAAESPGGGGDELDAVVADLADLFSADAATLLLASDRELRLAASTDRGLGGGAPVLYKPGQGLTGWVFRENRPLCIDDTEDAAEIRRKTGLDRGSAAFPERDAEGLITGQYLGVPMRRAGQVAGVVRVSRRPGADRFTRRDEEALQLFADLLGAGLYQSFRVELAGSIFESISEAIAVTRRDLEEDGHSTTRIVYANPGTERLLGRPADELQGREVREIYAPGEYEKVRESLLEAIAGLDEAGRGECGPLACQFQRADGAAVAAVVSYRLLSDRRVRPPALYAVGVAREASESEQMAARYQRLLEFLDAMDFAYFRADRDGFTVESTPADSRITGYSPAELRAMPRDRLYPDPKKRKKLIDIARDRRGQIVRVPLQLKRKNGKLFWAEGDLRIPTDAIGEEAGVEGIYRDVTERVRLQQFLNEESDELLSDHDLFRQLKQDAEFHLDYLSSVGHQILTPLSSLAGMLRHFESGALSVRQMQARLPWVTGQVRVCARLVRNLSFMDKILRGERFERRPLRLARLAIETKLDFDHQLEENRLTLRIDDASLDRLGTVQGHQELIRQVLVNLVDNAVKYSLPGSTIQVRGHHWPAGRIFEISNQGLPISPANRGRVFERGFRTPQAKASVPHGTGLGLWLVRKILAAHDAQIACTDERDDGATRVVFRITFPHPGPARGTRRSG